MQQLFLHIGYHKTGSTSLQGYLEQHRDELQAQGLYYPITRRDSARDYYNKHLKLFDDIVALKRDQSFISRARETLAPYVEEIISSGAPRAILSEESFSVFGPGGISALAPLTEHFEVKVLAVLRRQDRFLLSMYKQCIKECRETREFPSFVLDKKWGRLLYDEAMANWEAAFGAENLLVFSYDRLASGAASTLVATLLEALSVDVDSSASPGEEPRWNESIPCVCLEGMRQMCAHGDNKENLPALTRRFERLFSENPQLRQHPVFAGTYLTPEIAAYIRLRVAESNARASKRYSSLGPLFPGFEEPPAPYPTEFPSNLAAPFPARQIISALGECLAWTECH